MINLRAYIINICLSYSPFSDIGNLYRNNLVNNISDKPLKLACLYWHTVSDQGVDSLIDLLANFRNFQFIYSLFSDICILYRNNLVNKTSEQPLKDITLLCNYQYDIGYFL